MNQTRTAKNSLRQNASDEFSYAEENSTLKSLSSRSTDMEREYYSSNLSNDLLNDYLNDDLLEQIERQYLSKNTKKNRSPISITKANPSVPSSQDFNVHSLLHYYREPSLPEQASEVDDTINTAHINTKESMNTMVIENIIKSLINSTGSNCNKVIVERYIKDVVNINKTNQMWITNISKTDTSSCTLELQSISNTLSRKKIGPCEKVVRITVYSSHNGKPKKCIISTSHHPNFGFKTINDNWIFENSTELLPDTLIIPEQNILRFLQLTFIGSHTFSNTHRIKHVSVTLEDSIVTNKDYLERVKMEITGIPIEEPSDSKLLPNNKVKASPPTIPGNNIQSIVSNGKREKNVQILGEETIDLEETNPLLKILNTDTDVEVGIANEESNDMNSLREDMDDSNDLFEEEELEKELMQIEMKLNEKKKILDNINSPIKTTHLSPNKHSPNRVEEVKTPSPILIKNRLVTENNQQQESRPSVSFLEHTIIPVFKKTPPQRISPLKKSNSTPKKETKSNSQSSSKPIVIDFNPSFKRQSQEELHTMLNRKPNQSLLSFITQLQKYAPPKQTPRDEHTTNYYSPRSNNNAILEKLNMQKKLKEELEQLKHLNETKVRKEFSPPHIYTSPTKDVPFLTSPPHVEESINDSDDASSDITLTVEEDGQPTSPIGKHESALVFDISPPQSHKLRKAPSPPFRVVNDLSPREEENDFQNYYYEDNPARVHPNNFLEEEEDDYSLPSVIPLEVVEVEQEDYIPSPLMNEKIEVEETELDDEDLLTTLEDEVIEQFNRGSKPNSQNNSINIEIPKEIEDLLNSEEQLEVPEILPIKEVHQPPPIELFPSSPVPEDEFSIIQSFLDTTLSSENSFSLTPSKSPNTRLSSPLSLSIPQNELDSPRVELLTPSKILLKGEPSRLLRVKKGINCYLHDFDTKKKKYSIHKRILKLDRDSKYLSISKSGKSLFKKNTKIDLSKDIKWIVYGPYSQVFKQTNIIYRPFKCFSIVTQNKVYSFEILSEGIRDVDDTILGIQYLIQDRIKSFKRPIYTKCNLIVKRYLLKKYITFTNTSITADDEMSSITSDSLVSPRMMRSKSFKF